MDSRDRRFRLRPVALATLLALAPTFLPVAAFAQSAEDRASARVVAEEADKKMQAGDYAGAVDSFTKAFALVPAPTIKVARAHALLKLGRLIEAQQDLLDAARSNPQAGEPPAWGEARHKAVAEAATITPRLPLVVIQVTGATQDQITILVDNVQIPSAALGAPRALDPGQHMLKAWANGFYSTEQAVTVAEGEHKDVTLALTPMPAAAVAAVPVAPVVPVAPAPVPTTPAPDATPAAQPTPPPADATPAPVPAAQPAAVEPAPVQPAPNNTLSTVSWIGAGVFGAVGAITGAVAVAQAGDVKSKCNGNSCLESAQGEANSSSTLGTISTVTFVLAGGSVLLAILTHHSKPKPASAATIDFTFGPGAIGAVGRF